MNFNGQALGWSNTSPVPMAVPNIVHGYLEIGSVDFNRTYSQVTVLKSQAGACHNGTCSQHVWSCFENE